MSYLERSRGREREQEGERERVRERERERERERWKGHNITRIQVKILSFFRAKLDIHAFLSSGEFQCYSQISICYWMKRKSASFTLSKN